MLDLLRRRDQRGIDRRRPLEGCHHLLSFFQKPHRSFAGLPSGLTVKALEDLANLDHVPFGLFQMQFKRLLQWRAGGGFRHLWQRLRDPALGIVNV